MAASFLSLFFQAPFGVRQRVGRSASRNVEFAGRLSEVSENDHFGTTLNTNHLCVVYKLCLDYADAERVFFFEI